jgi:hypothetical protein
MRFGVSISYTILRGISLLPLPWFANVLFYAICVLNFQDVLLSRLPFYRGFHYAFMF